MALHTEISVNAQVFHDSTKNSPSFGLKFSDKVLDTLVLESSTRKALAASADNQEVDLQGIGDGKLIALHSTSSFWVKFNGTGNAAITLAPQTNSSTSAVTPAFLIMLADGITSVHLGNPSSSAAIEVDVGIAGTAS